MAVKPTDYPDFAVNDVVDPVSGVNNVEEPEEAKKLIGWERHERPPRQWMNWIHRFTGLWVRYFDETIDNLIIGNNHGLILGELRTFAFEAVPDGWLECDGSAISRTTYADLFAAIGTRFGEGDGDTTFNVPDMRGKFPRGWDHGAGNDPDANIRTDSGDGTTGDRVGTKQLDAFQGHWHEIIDGVGEGDQPDLSADFQGSAVNNDDVRDPVAMPGMGTPRISSETRPQNVYMMYCIYAGV